MQERRLKMSLESKTKKETSNMESKGIAMSVDCSGIIDMIITDLKYVQASNENTDPVEVNRCLRKAKGLLNCIEEVPEE